MSEAITITEALAEIKTLGKRIAKKREHITQYLARAEGTKDPLERDGGSSEFIGRERQAVADLEERLVELRRRIAEANARTSLTIAGHTRTIADWLTWRREVAPGAKQFLGTLQGAVQSLRQQALQRGVQVFSAVSVSADANPNDIVVNVSEADISAEVDDMETVLGALDGQLSLKNATTTI